MAVMTNRAGLALALCLTTSLAGCDLDPAKFAGGDVTTWKCDKEPGSKEEYAYIPYQYIIQAPADTIGVSGDGEYKSAVLLGTNDPSQKIPADWRIGAKYTFASTSDHGFAISGSAQGLRGSIKQTLALDGESGKMRVENGDSITNLKCTRVGNWKSAVQSVKSGPNIIYIEKRLSAVPFFRKKLGDLAFTSEVAKESSLNDDFGSVYGLLSPFPASSLATQESDLVETAKNRLIADDTSSYDVWEWNNSWEGGAFYTDEEKSSRCSNLSGSTYAEGYKIISSTPQDRIGGTNLTCHGTLHLLKKEGSLQAQKPADLFPMNYD